MREAKGIMISRAARSKKDAVVAAVAADVAAARKAGVGRNTTSSGSSRSLAVDNSRRATIGSSSANGGSLTKSRIPTFKGQRMSIKRCENTRHVSLNAAKINGNKSRIPTRRVVEQNC